MSNYSSHMFFNKIVVDNTTEIERMAAAKVDLLNKLPIGAKPIVSTLEQKTSESFVGPYQMITRSEISLL